MPIQGILRIYGTLKVALLKSPVIPEGIFNHFDVDFARAPREILSATALVLIGKGPSDVLPYAVRFILPLKLQPVKYL